MGGGFDVRKQLTPATLSILFSYNPGPFVKHAAAFAQTLATGAAGDELCEQGAQRGRLHPPLARERVIGPLGDLAQPSQRIAARLEQRADPAA